MHDVFVSLTLHSDNASARCFLVFSTPKSEVFARCHWSAINCFPYSSKHDAYTFSFANSVLYFCDCSTNMVCSCNGCRWVDEVIPDAPWVITQEFLDKHQIGTRFFSVRLSFQDKFISVVQHGYGLSNVELSILSFFFGGPQF